MRRIAPRVLIDIGPEDLDSIERQAAQLLAEVGLAVPLPQARERLAAHRALRLEGERVHFDGDYVLEALQAQRRSAPRPTGHHLEVSAGGGALSILDHRTASLRRPSTEDLLLTLRIGDRLGLGGDPPLIPSDIPMPLCEVALYKLAWENTRRFSGRDIGSIAVGEYVYEMARAAGKPFHLPLYMISPLRVNAENLEIILHFADRLPAVGGSTMPMPGATAPLLAPGYLAQALAEMIGGYLLLSLLLPQATVHMGAKVLAFDPFANGIGCGSPESLLQGQLEVALLGRYGRVAGHHFWSMAGGCDAQAAAERMAGVLLGALAGVRQFGVAGRLQGEAFSLAQLLIDLEIAAYVERLLQGQLWAEPEDWLAETRNALAEGTFLGAPSTAAHYRAETWLGRLFSRHSLAQRQQMAEPGLQERIRRRVDALDQPAPEYLSAPVRDELERIYRHAQRHLAP